MYNICMIRINLCIDPVILGRLKKQARAEGRTVSEIIRQVIVEYLKRQEDEDENLQKG